MSELDKFEETLMKVTIPVTSVDPIATPVVPTPTKLKDSDETLIV